jgi:hypothetical protein
VVNETLRVTNEYSIETLAFSSVPNDQQGFADTLLARKWPAEWFSEYVRNNYIRIDASPKAREVNRSTRGVGFGRRR